MQEYNVEIIETSSKYVTVTASSADTADRVVRSMYHGEEITLDYSDFDKVEFNTVRVLQS
jgi:hypothetical protein